MNTEITAEKAIEAIENETTVFLGQTVRKHNYQYQIRDELCKMCEAGNLSPREYMRALKITWAKMSERDRQLDLC